MRAQDRPSAVGADSTLVHVRRVARVVASMLLAPFLLLSCDAGEDGPAAPSAGAGARVAPGEPWVAYHWYQPGEDTKDIFLARPDGSDRHVVAGDVPGDHVGPSWSPDGTTIAFTNRDDLTPNGAIWTVRADGTGAALLSDGEGQCPDGIFHPAWFPDGSRLAVICYPDADHAQVAVLDPATKSLTSLYETELPLFLDNAPTVSPDGGRIAFDSLRWDPSNTYVAGSRVGVIPVTGGPVHWLTTMGRFMSYPDWSPDGSRLVMNSYDLGNIQNTRHPSNIFTIRPDGTGLRQLTHSSVDGRLRIAQPHWVQPALVDAAGGEPVLLVEHVDGGAPDWRPTP